MQLERIYWLIGLVIVFIGIAIICLIIKQLRHQKERYATYGARYRADKEFLVADSGIGATRIIKNRYSPEVPSSPTLTNTDFTPATPPVLPKTMCFYVRAKNHEQFFGYDLLQAILNQGFVHGSGDFFHYAEQVGHTIISLANAAAPGTFNLDQMGAFTTQGLCLFIQPQRLVKPLAAFDLMVHKATLLAEELRGIVEDEHHHLLTAERLNE